MIFKRSIFGIAFVLLPHYRSLNLGIMGHIILYQKMTPLCDIITFLFES